MSRLAEKYKAEVAPTLMREFSYSSKMLAPRLIKITVNMGVGEAVANPQALDHAVTDMTKIVGQKPVITRAKKSIATYKLRQGMAIGCMATLRRQRMWNFLDRLISVALPQVRDFRGLSPKAFDGHGNYSLGIKEQIIFPEINFDQIDKVRGMNITIHTSASRDEHAHRLLQLLGVPFRKG